MIKNNLEKLGPLYLQTPWAGVETKTFLVHRELINCEIDFPEVKLHVRGHNTNVNWDQVQRSGGTHDWPLIGRERSRDLDTGL